MAAKGTGVARRFQLLVASAALALAACVAPQTTVRADAAPGRCALPAPEILMEAGDPNATGGTLLQVWDVAESPALWLPIEPEGGDYARFRAAVAALGVETDAVALLKASLAAWADNEALTHNNALAIANAESWIGPAGCLERLLVGIQHGRIDTFEAPTEFAAFVLRSADGGRLRIYSYTVNQDWIGRADPINEPVARDHAAGWTVVAGVHNHAFHPGQPGLDGVLAPSSADAQFNAAFRESAGMQQAWITNGIDTIRIPASAFDRFRHE